SRLRRVALLALALAVVVSSLLYIWWPSLHNIRGPIARLCDHAVMVALVVMLCGVIIVIWDNTRVYSRFAFNLSEHKSEWDEGTVLEKSSQTGFDREVVPSLLDVELIAKETAAVNHSSYWPVAMILLSLLSLHPMLDAWPFQ